MIIAKREQRNKLFQFSVLSHPHCVSSRWAQRTVFRDRSLYQVQDDVNEVLEGLAARKDVAKPKVMTFTRLPRTLPETVHSIDNDVYIIFPTIRHDFKE